MAARILLLCGVAVLQWQTALAAPLEPELGGLAARRGSISLTVIESRENSKQKAKDSLSTLSTTSPNNAVNQIAPSGDQGSPSPPVGKNNAPSPLHPLQRLNGAFLSFVDGEHLPPSKDPKCQDFVLKGPFLSLHALMGSSGVRGIAVENYSAQKIGVGNNQSLVDAGLVEFENNERMTKFSIAKQGSFPGVVGFKFETTSGNKYEALSGMIKNGAMRTIDWQELKTGSGILAQITGTSCQAMLGSVGFDFLDELASISISKIDYDGFSNNVMPTGKGVQMSVGSQILDNRNSSNNQIMTLTTTDAVTKQTTILTEIRTQFGGAVQLKTEVGVPFVATAEIMVEANWNIALTRQKQAMDNTITTRAGTFNLSCPPRKFCKARAFFTQYKLEVKMTATMEAMSKTGHAYTWIQGGTFKGADSLAMQFNITELDRPQHKRIVLS